jgi:hypothetical protein
MMADVAQQGRREEASSRWSSKGSQVEQHDVLVPLADLLNHSAGSEQPNAHCFTTTTATAVSEASTHTLTKSQNRFSLQQHSEFTLAQISATSASVSSAQKLLAQKPVFQCAVLADVPADTQLVVKYLSDYTAGSTISTSTDANDYLSNRELWATYGFTRATTSSYHGRRRRRRRSTRGNSDNGNTPIIREVVADMHARSCEALVLAKVPSDLANGVARLLETQCIRCIDLLRVYEEEEMKMARKSAATEFYSGDTHQVGLRLRLRSRRGTNTTAAQSTYALSCALFTVAALLGVCRTFVPTCNRVHHITPRSKQWGFVN